MSYQDKLDMSSLQNWDSSLERELDRLLRRGKWRRVESIGWWVGKVYRWRVA